VQTADALWWYALGLPGYSAVKILVPLYYALGTTRIPVISSFAMVAVNTALNYLMIEAWHMPFWSLAAATSVTSTINGVFLYFWLRRHIPALPTGRLLRGVAASLILGILVWLACKSTNFAVNLAVIKLIGAGGALRELTAQSMALIWALNVALAVAASSAIWLFVGNALKLPEIKEGWGAVTSRLRRRKGAARG
jgi:putative peptidoglycan lipid II flippase